MRRFSPTPQSTSSRKSATLKLIIRVFTVFRENNYQRTIKSGVNLHPRLTAPVQAISMEVGTFHINTVNVIGQLPCLAVEIFL
jgi:hypothetical protein